MVRTADMKPAQGRDLAETVERARAAWAGVWALRDEPVERFTLDFESGWSGCGEVMAAIGSLGVSDVSWRHDPPRHHAEFSCTFETLKSAQLAARGTSVPKDRMHFQRKIGG